MRVSSQEHKEESAGKKVLPKSRFFDLYFNKNQEEYCQDFFHLSLTHTFPVTTISLRDLPPNLIWLQPRSFCSTAGHGKNPQGHQGSGTLFLFVFNVCFSLFLFIKGNIPSLVCPLNGFQFAHRKCAGLIPASIIPILFMLSLSTLQPHIKR